MRTNINRIFWGWIILVFGVIVFLSGCVSNKGNNAHITSCDNGTAAKPLDQDFKFPGTLLFADRLETEIIALDGETHEVIPILDDIKIEDTSISPLTPDGKWLMVFQNQISDQGQVKIQLISYQGIIENKSIFFIDSYFGERKIEFWQQVIWRNNSVIQGHAFSSNLEGAYEMGEITLLNPFQMNWSIITKKYDLPEHAADSGYSVSPDFSRIIFLNKKYNLVLYDLIHNRKLWEYSERNDIYKYNNQSTIMHDVVWSDDGSIFAIPIANTDKDVRGILVMDKNGNMVNFMDYRNDPYGLSWSHDGKKIAFGISRCSDLECETIIPIISLYRVEGDLIQDICALGEDYDSRSIQWSPDDEYIAYASLLNSSTNTKILIQKLDDSQVRIVEIEGRELKLLGWSKYKWVIPTNSN